MAKKKFKFPSIRKLDVVVLGAALILVGFGLYARIAADDAKVCRAIGQNHPIFLEKGNFNPRKITVQQCDTITLVNRDTNEFQLAFGNQQKHIPYPGFREQALRTNESLSIDMVQSGTYTLHDHHRHEVTVDITVVAAK